MIYNKQHICKISADKNKLSILDKNLLDTIESLTQQNQHDKQRITALEEALIECKACRMMPGEIERIVTEAINSQ